MKIEKELLSAAKSGKDNAKAQADLEAFYIEHFGLHGGHPYNYGSVH